MRGRPVSRTYDNVLKFIIDYKEKNGGNSPTFREIGEACNMSSTAHVTFALESLEKQGRIEMKGIRGIIVK